MQIIETRSEEVVSEEICVDTEITESQITALVNLLNKYRHCIVKNLNELSNTDKVAMDIEVHNEAVVQAKPYRLNARDGSDLDDIIEEYRKAGIITKTTSTYTSPAFIAETQIAQFERAMFGLANAPRYFAKLMDKTLCTARKRGIAFSFCDDICIWENP